MRRVFPFLITGILLHLVHPAAACTTFFIHHNGEMVFGRNYDWVTGSGMLCTNQRGLVKTSAEVPDGSTITWTSRFGSVTFNQYGKEFPTGGMNEKGLVVELMWLDETKYPAKDDRPAVGVLQWIQFQLDNCSTVEEVIATGSKLRITASTTPLHYLVADATGKGATIEFLEGKMVVHTGQQLKFPVLTNSVYQESVNHASGIFGKQDQPGVQTAFTGSSLGRFAEACQMVSTYKAGSSKRSSVDFSFDILKNVSQGNFTQWSIVYDLKNLRIYFTTREAPIRKWISFQSIFQTIGFECRESSRYTDLNSTHKGDLQNQLKPFNSAVNLQMIQRAAEQSRTEIRISPERQKAAADYAAGIHCKN